MRNMTFIQATNISEMGNKRGLIATFQVSLILVFLFNNHVSECCSRKRNDDTTPTMDKGIFRSN